MYSWLSGSNAVSAKTLLVALLFCVPSSGAAVTVGNDDITFVAVSNDYPGAGQSTWYYTVTSGAKPAISHINFALPDCLSVVGAGTWGPLRTNLTPGGGLPEVGTDPTTGVSGIKFDEGFEEGESRNYYFSVNGNYASSPILVASKGGPGFDTGMVTGPGSCGAPAATPTPTFTATRSHTNTPTATTTRTSTPTQTPTPSNTHTQTPTPSDTHTQTPTPSDTHTQTPTPSDTHTQTPTPSSTHTPTSSPTHTVAPTDSPTVVVATAVPEIVSTATPKPTDTATPVPATATPAAIATNTSDDSRAGAGTPTPTATSAAPATPVPTGAPDLQLSKHHSGSFRADRNGTYYLTVTNVGSGSTTGVITVTDPLPTGLSYLSGNGSGWTCTAVGSVVTCVSSTPLAPADSSIITLTVSVSASASAVTINTASVSTDGDAAFANNSASDATNVMNTIAATATPVSTATPTHTEIATAIPATATPSQTGVATAVPPTATPIQTATATTIAATATPTRTNTSVATPTKTARGMMNVRLVAVGRVNPTSEMYYSIALVTYSRGTTRQVQAYLELPPEVEVVSINPPATTAPPVGATGEIFWNLGDLTGPANRPIEVKVRVSRYATLGTQFTSRLRIENGHGETYELERMSRVGGYDAPLLNKLKTSDLIMAVTAPRVVRAGDALTYKISASSHKKQGFSAPQIHALLPAGITPTSISPQPLYTELQPSGETLCEWQISGPVKRLRIVAKAVASRDITPGDILETHVTLNDVDGTQGLVTATHGVP